MMGKFLLKTVGRLKLTDEQSLLYSNISIEARKYLKPEKMKMVGELLNIC